MYPQTLNNLKECFKKLPGIGDKTAERLAFHVLELDDEIIDLFSDSIKNVKVNTKKCQYCNNLTENDLCDICLDKSRNRKTICVVDDPKNIILFEKMGSYSGIYYVLNNLISPLDGINPEDINLDKLIERIENEDIKEVILAVKPSIESETTALYIVKLLEGKDVVVSKIASGIPIGADMEYIDSLTLELALEDRKNISKQN